MSSLWDRLELKPEQEASKEFEENGKLLWSSLDDSRRQARVEQNQIS